DAGFVPYVLVDKVSYRDSPPWPVGAVDGGGLSLQRKNGLLYGNEGLNWVGAAPTPGAANLPGLVAPPAISAPPQDQVIYEGDPSSLAVAATGIGPLEYQWRLNGRDLPDATNTTFSIGYTALDDDGNYDCVVHNAGGAAVSASARLQVVSRPTVLIPPANVIARAGTNIAFAVFATGSGGLRYQW